MIESSHIRTTKRLARDAAIRIREVVGSDALVLWIGSWVTGRAVEKSDIDLAIDIGRLLRGEERVRIMEALEDLPTLRSFDVLDFASVSEERRQEIRAEGLAL